MSVKIMPDTAALDDYLGKTAGALFRLAAEVTAPHRAAEIEPSVRAAGIAYGLTGLMRALPVHASRGRVDLPAALPREARKVFLPLALVEPYLSALRKVDPLRQVAEINPLYRLWRLSTCRFPPSA